MRDLAPSALHGRFSRASSPFGLLQSLRVLRICEHFNTVNAKSQQKSRDLSKTVTFAVLHDGFVKFLYILHIRKKVHKSVDLFAVSVILVIRVQILVKALSVILLFLLDTKASLVQREVACTARRRDC
jgi:hypothetical protein